MLTRKQRDGLIRIRDRGPSAWCEGQYRAGGAVGRMFDKMASEGFCTPPPYTITDKGIEALGGEKCCTCGTLHPDKHSAECIRFWKPMPQRGTGPA